MRILLTGANGQVGWELARALAPLGEVIGLDRSRLDLAQPDALRETVRAIAPDAIVNAAAYTAVDRAESEPELARAINAIAPGVLAEEAQRLDAILVHYSTDYVFDGTKSEPYVETDPTNPLSVYGRTKLEGERAIGASGCRHLTLRTSWVYGARGQNFLLTMLRLARERRQLEDRRRSNRCADLVPRYRASDGDVARAAGARGARCRGPVSLDRERGDVVVRLRAGDLRLAGDGAARRRTAGDRGYPDERLSNAGKAAAELAAGLQSARAPCRDTARAVGCGTPQCSRRSRLAVDQHYRGRQAYACGAGEELAIERPQRVAAPGACVVEYVREIKPVRQQAYRFENCGLPLEMEVSDAKQRVETLGDLLRSQLVDAAQNPFELERDGNRDETHVPGVDQLSRGAGLLWVVFCHQPCEHVGVERDHRAPRLANRRAASAPLSSSVRTRRPE